MAPVGGKDRMTYYGGVKTSHEKSTAGMRHLVDRKARLLVTLTDPRFHQEDAYRPRGREGGQTRPPALSVLASRPWDRRLAASGRKAATGPDDCLPA